MDGVGVFGSSVPTVGILPAFLVLRGLSYRERPGPVWIGPSGARVTSTDERYCAAHGIDRAWFFYLATEARRQGRIVKGTCYQLARMFGASWPRCTVLLRLRRVAASAVEAPRHGSGCRCNCTWMPRRAIVANSVEHRRGSDTFIVELTDEFMEEVKRGAPVLIAAVAELLSTCAALELYSALVLRAHRGDQLPLALFERGGLCDQIDLAEADFKVRQDIEKRLRRINRVWSELPYRLDGNYLICTTDPRAALAAHVGAPARPPITPKRSRGLPVAPAPVVYPAAQGAPRMAESTAPGSQFTRDALPPRSPEVYRALMAAERQFSQSVAGLRAATSARTATMAPTRATSKPAMTASRRSDVRSINGVLLDLPWIRKPRRGAVESEKSDNADTDPSERHDDE